MFTGLNRLAHRDHTAVQASLELVSKETAWAQHRASQLEVLTMRQRIEQPDDTQNGASTETSAERDLRYLLRRLDSSPVRRLLRRYPGFRSLTDRWL